ncbi:MAG: helix-turn-helix domain-containing protein, partial [Litorimonas sp.]
MSPPLNILRHNKPATADRPSLPLGGRLRAQRKALGWTMEDAAKRSGVRAEYLLALENHDLEALPTVGYGLGYVRAYARALGLDAQASVADFKRDSEMPRNLGRPSKPHFVPKRRVRLPRGSVPALGALAAMVMLGTWYG